jgi:hypothetical protein
MLKTSSLITEFYVTTYDAETLVKISIRNCIYPTPVEHFERQICNAGFTFDDVRSKSLPGTYTTLPVTLCHQKTQSVGDISILIEGTKLV